AEETVLINPEVLRESGEQIVEEGCLSLPGVTAKIRRPVELVIRGYDLEGN
ncbi:MAG: peptide deformylase, partial [Planctomycetes bacterium]|nr:peptide deformylase [Planctomycetota bacterium]